MLRESGRNGDAVACIVPMIQYLQNCLEGKASKKTGYVTQTTNKKVFVTRFERESLPGFVQSPGGFGEHSVELLTPSGALLEIPYSDVKAVCFVRDFESGETWREHRSFATRPKSPGLWVRFVFRDHDTAEGLLASNLMQVEPLGFYMVPPDPTFHNQRIFVPRTALREVLVLGVIGSALRRKKSQAAKGEDGQIEMF
jgi:hypothetical protein